MLDCKIVGGSLLDGTGAAAARLDVGVEGDRIAALGDLSRAEARTVVQAGGRCVVPGFVDVHSHSDAFLLIEPSAPSKLAQGVTTEVVGNCGCSAAPLADPGHLSSDWRAYEYPAPWRTMGEYRQRVAGVTPAPNVVMLAGHGMLRKWVMGHEPRPARPEEQAAMVRLLDQCFDEGARGFSTGLIYPPGLFAGPDEITALARVAARRGGLYASHMRNEGPGLIEAIDEILAVARDSGARIQISHLKTQGPAAWPRLGEALERLRRARDEGIEVAADRYPYTASSTDLDVVLPTWAKGGGAEAILARLRDPALRARIRADVDAARPPSYWKTVTVGSTAEPRFHGQPLTEVAGALGLDPVDAALRLIESDELKTSAFFFGMNEANLWAILAEPDVMIGSDASIRALDGPLSRDYPHPRAFGSFPRFLRAALDGRTVPLPEAVRKMTALPAAQFRLAGRGTLARGAFADVVVFDPATVRDRATYACSRQLAEGIEWVLVNGVPTVANGRLTGRRAGRIL